MKSLTLLATASAVVLGLASGAMADPLVFGGSAGNPFDIGGPSNGPFATSGSPWSTSVLSADGIGTANFGGVAMTTAAGVGGVYNVTSGGLQSLMVVLPTSTLSGNIQWADMANGTSHLHLDGTYTYTASVNDPVFDKMGSIPIDLISNELPGGLTLETWANNDKLIGWSSGDAGGPGGSVPEPGTLALLGAMLIAGGLYYQGRNRAA